jgi:hypothetical protein
LYGVGQRKIKYAIFDSPITVVCKTLPWMGKIGGYGDLMARGVGNIFSSKIYGGHWDFFKHQNHNQSIEAIKKRIPDCKINVI